MTMNTMKGNPSAFIMIPNKYLVNSNIKDEHGNTIKTISSTLKQSNHKEAILIHITLMRLRNIDYEIHTTLGAILQMTRINNRTENIAKLKSVLYKMTGIDFSENKANDYIYFVYDPIDKNDDGQNINFFTIEMITVNKLLGIKNSLNKYNYLNLYCYIKCRMYKSPKGQEYNLHGKYETCSPNTDELTNSLNISRRDVFSILSDLKDKQLIYYENAGYYKTDTGVRQARNTYITTERMDYIKQVKQSIKFYRERMTRQYDYEWVK